MFIVITGLDGSGTTSVAEKLHAMDVGSILLKTPSKEYVRDLIDINVRECSQMAHYLFYLSSVVYMSDYIKSNFDYINNNVYCVRYLIDTVVSHRVAGLDVPLEYENEMYSILKPDLTIWVGIDENVRQNRITKRGKSILDKVLDNSNIRDSFLQEFAKLLDNAKKIDNTSNNLDFKINKLFNDIIRRN